MRIFKTICHNNIHRDYTDELIKVDSKKDEPALLWKDTRPTYIGNVKILCPMDSIGEFDIIDLVVNKEYEMRIEEQRVYIIIDNNPCAIVCGGKQNNTILGLGDGFVLDTLDYHEFFYSEGQMRDNKLKELGI